MSLVFVKRTTLAMLQRGLRRMSATTLDSASIARLKQIDSSAVQQSSSPTHHQPTHQHHHHHHPHQQQQSAAMARLLNAAHAVAVR